MSNTTSAKLVTVMDLVDRGDACRTQLDMIETELDRLFGYSVVAANADVVTPPSGNLTDRLDRSLYDVYSRLVRLNDFLGIRIGIPEATQPLPPQSRPLSAGY